MIKESGAICPDWDFLPITFSVPQLLCIKNSILFFPLDKLNNFIQVHGTSSQPWHKDPRNICTTACFTLDWLSAKTWVQHVRREKCKNIKWKQYLSSNRFCLYSSKGLEGRNCLLRPESWSWSLYCRLFTVLYFSVRWSRSRALRYGLPSCMSVKTS